MNEYQSALQQREAISGPNTKWFKAPVVPGNDQALPMQRLAGNLVQDVRSEPATIEAFTPRPGSQETTTSRDRALAQLIRNLPPLLLTGVFSFGLVAVLNATVGSLPLVLSLVLWPALAMLWWSIENRMEREYSVNGLERRRADLAAGLEQQRERNRQTIRLKMLDYYLNGGTEQ